MELGLSFDSIRTIPPAQKYALLAILVGGIISGFYYYVMEPKSNIITALGVEVGKLDTEIQTLTIKVAHLDELIAAKKQLELELEKKKERLPPESEAVMLLKQLSDLGIRLGLDIKLWKPGTMAEDPSKLFIRMPVSVEVAGGYHTAALFFDRISKLARIINVSDLRMGSAKVERDHVVIQTQFDLIAFVAPTPAAPAPAPAAKP